MKTIFTLAFIMTMTFAKSQHTFSIVAVDSVTGEIGSAGATCLPDEMGAIDISDIILGVGAIHTQAWWTSVNQVAARNRLNAGDSPQEIIDWLQANDNTSEGGGVSDRQYGIVDLNNGNPRSAAYTGNNNYDQKGHRVGPGYSIQGNILISQAVLDDMEEAFLNTPGELCEKLMAVMQAAKRPGADMRCLNQGVSSGSAFIRVAKPTDTDNSYGNLWLDLNVWANSGTFTGDPIDELQNQFDLFKETTGLKEQVKHPILLYPNPSNGIFEISSEVSINRVEVISSMGEVVKYFEFPVGSTKHQMDLTALADSIYFLKIHHKYGIDNQKITIQSK